MKRGIYLPAFESFGDVNLLVELAVATEEKGWDGFFLWDHIRYERPVPMVDAYIACAAIATATERIRFGPLITPLARRRPQKVARESVSIDHLSNGRFVLGVGLGIDFWGEYSAFDEPATDDKQRAVLLDKGIGDIIRYWGGELLPPPVQQPRIPIWSSGFIPMRPGPIERARRLDGVMPWSPKGTATPEMIKEMCDQIGRDDDFDVVLAVDQGADAAAYEAAGLTWMLDSFSPEAPVDLVRQVITAGPG